MFVVFKIKQYLLDVHVWCTFLLCGTLIFFFFFWIRKKWLSHYSLTKLIIFYVVIVFSFWTAILFNWTSLGLLFRKFVILCVHTWVDIEFYFSDFNDLIPRFLFAASKNQEYSFLLKSKNYDVLFPLFFKNCTEVGYSYFFKICNYFIDLNNTQNIFFKQNYYTFFYTFNNLFI